jgi:hypothetical protein
MVDITEIERRVDRAVTATIPVTTKLGGIDPENYGQVMEFSKAMSTCRAGIPAWLRGSVGDCLMICTRALRWGMDPFFVAEKSYVMQSKSGEVRVGWESQLVHAVIEALAPIKGRLRHRFEGDGDDTVCIVWATFKGEDTPHEYTSVSLGKRIKDIGKNDKGNFRGSPNWLTKPRVQLFYDASRDWARINCPDVLAGVYTRDELPDHEPVDVTPEPSKTELLSQRLKDAKAKNVERSKGFDADGVNSTIEGNANSGDAEQDGGAKNERVDESIVEGRQGDVGDRTDLDRDQVGSEGSSGDAGEVGGEPAGSQAEDAEDQSEVFPPDRSSGSSGGTRPKGKTKR